MRIVVVGLEQAGRAARPHDRTRHHPSQPILSHGIATPETRLLLAVLEEALNTRQRHLAATDPRSRRLLAEVEAWFRSDDAARLCAFVAICNALEIEPTWMRARLGLSESARRPPATTRASRPLLASPRGRDAASRDRESRGHVEGDLTSRATHVIPAPPW
jgi:hypothetical protein